MRFEPRNCNLSPLLIGALALGACGDQPADTATSGQPEPLVQDVNYGTWAAGLQAPGNLLATHSTLLRNNKILVVGGSSYNCCFSFPTKKEEARLYDIASGTWSAAPLASPAPFGTTKDAFCSGHVHDDQGRVVFQGGLRGYATDNGHGIADSAVYDPFFSTSGRFTPIGQAPAPLNWSAPPLWYPTLLAGPRHTFIFPGNDVDGHHNYYKMKYGGTLWENTGKSARTTSTYPRMALLPDGRIFSASRDVTTGRNVMFDPVANTVTVFASATPTAGQVTPTIEPGELRTWTGSGALLPLIPTNGVYPSVKYLLTNGARYNTSEPYSAYTRDLLNANSNWVRTKPRPAEANQWSNGSLPNTSGAQPRWFGTATLLPNLQVFVTGGVANPGSDATRIGVAEVYDPTTDDWFATRPATVARNYHSVSLLLPDGRVWTASGSQNEAGSDCGGGTICDPNEPERTEERVEIFTPYYVNSANRPTITSCPSQMASDGGLYRLTTAGTSTINKVVLIRAGSVTHSFDGDQRALELERVVQSGNNVTFRSPFGAAAAPPGDYMLFAVRQVGTGPKSLFPSAACWTRVQPQAVRHNVMAADYDTVMTDMANLGYRPTAIDGFEMPGSLRRFNMVFTSSHPVLNQSVSRRDMSWDSYSAEWNARVAEGYCQKWVDTYNMSSGETNYAAIFEKGASCAGVAWYAYSNDEANHNLAVADLTAQGYHPVNVSVTLEFGTRYFTTLWDNSNVGTWFMRQKMSESQYQTEINTQLAAGRAVSYMSTSVENGAVKISAIWTQRNVGAWTAKHGVTATGFQNEHDNQLSRSQQARQVAGYHAVESTGSITPRFAAVWSQK